MRFLADLGTSRLNRSPVRQLGNSCSQKNAVTVPHVRLIFQCISMDFVPVREASTTRRISTRRHILRAVRLALKSSLYGTLVMSSHNLPTSRLAWTASDGSRLAQAKATVASSIVQPSVWGPGVSPDL